MVSFFFKFQCTQIIKQCHHLGIGRRLGIYSISPPPSKFDSEASRRGRPGGRGCRSGAGTGSWSSCHRDGTRTRAWSCRYCSEAGFHCSKLTACRYWGNHCLPSVIRKVPLASTWSLQQSGTLCKFQNNIKWIVLPLHELSVYNIVCINVMSSRIK